MQPAQGAHTPTQNTFILPINEINACIGSGVSTQPEAADAAATQPQADKTASNCASKERA
jgi:hypothetical protein